MTDDQILSAYLDGELSPEPAREVEARLRSDAEFRRKHARQLEVSLHLKVHCRPDPEFLSRHRRRREELSPVLHWTWRQLGYRLTAAAAGLLIAAGLSLWRAMLPVELPAMEGAADTAALDPDLDLLAFEGAVLGASPTGLQFPGPDPATQAGNLAGDEPVLLIAVGGGFLPTGELRGEPRGER